MKSFGHPDAFNHLDDQDHSLDSHLSYQRGQVVVLDKDRSHKVLCHIPEQFVIECSKFHAFLGAFGLDSGKVLIIDFEDVMK